MEQQESWTETQESSEESYMGGSVLNEQELLNVVGGGFPVERSLAARRVEAGGLVVGMVVASGYGIYELVHK
jgi:hypothetical protein